MPVKLNGLPSKPFRTFPSCYKCQIFLPRHVFLLHLKYLTHEPNRQPEK